MNKVIISLSPSADAELLTMIFVTLKLCGVIEWKWVWVISPLWIFFAVAILWGIIKGVSKND